MSRGEILVVFGACLLLGLCMGGIGAFALDQWRDGHRLFALCIAGAIAGLGSVCGGLLLIGLRL